MTINYAPDDPVAGASRASGTTEVQRWADYADTIADVDTRIDTLESGASRLLLPAPGMHAVGPALSTTTSPTGDPSGRISSLNFDAAAYEYSLDTFLVPAGWATADAYIWWSNAATSTGDVIWRCQMGAYGDAETVTTPANTDTTAAAPADALTMKRTKVVSAVALTAGELGRFLIQRRGGDAGDTLANDAALFAVELVKVS